MSQAHRLFIVCALTLLYSFAPVRAGSINSTAVTPEAAAAHATITQYNGPATCVACHAGPARGAFKGLHYQWTSPTPDVFNIVGNAGKGERAFNTYCGSPTTSPRFTCAACHAGYGGTPSPTYSQSQVNNVDCMMCHQQAWKRKFAGPFVQQTYTDYQGTPHTWNFPQEDTAGNFAFMPDETGMGRTAVQAAQTVHMPTRSACLNCHARAAGTDGGKRGDLSSVNVDPPLASDVHMSSQGQNLSCQACHVFNHHKVIGRGLDLPSNDHPARLDCTQCHSARPHTDTRRNNHTAHVACQTCHIARYAKDISTEISRDWTVPVWNTTVFSGQGGYKAEEPRGQNLTPTYLFFNHTSQVYTLDQGALYNASIGAYEMGLPNGSAADHWAQIYPMKEHWSKSARLTNTGQLVPHSTFRFFATGDWTQAVQEGMSRAGLSGTWTTVNVHTYQTINHGVEPKASALACGKCHSSLSGGPVVMDLKGKLGYALKGPTSTVCFQCHGSEDDNLSFTGVHDKHVTSRGYDCVWCHTFTRPERNLKIPTGQDTDADKVVNSFDNCVSVSNHDQIDTDRDGVGDACDTDKDGDGILDIADNCSLLHNPDQADQDNDHVGDVCDDCYSTPAGVPVDAKGCPLPVPGDFDLDGDVDQADFAREQLCLGYVTPFPSNCTSADLNKDGSITFLDVNVFAQCMSGANVPANPACAN